MGTNYYWYESGEIRCPHCGQERPKLHIGKDSRGWVFGLRAHENEGIVSLADWLERWKMGVIVDEEERLVTPAAMRAIIEDPGDLKKQKRRHLGNHLMGSRDVHPGGPTWEMIPYEFS